MKNLKPIEIIALSDDNSIKIETTKIKDGDTIILTVDTDIWDVNQAALIMECLSKFFPHNNIITTFKGVEISIENCN